MSKGQTKKTREAAGNRRKLTRAEKKQIAAVIRQAKGDGKAHTAQQTIPYLAMYPDGICKVAQRKYSKSIYNEGGKRGLMENINAALPFMDEDMRELAKRTLAKIAPLTENEYTELAIFAADEV